MARKIKTIDINRATKKELLTYARNNARYVNSLLDSLEKADKAYSKAYQYTQNRLRNKSYMKVGKSGDLRFFSTKKQIETLTQGQLRELVKNIQGYKQTRSGSVAGQRKIEDEIFEHFKETAKEWKLDLGIDFTRDKFEEIVKSEDFQNLKSAESYSSSVLFEFMGKYGTGDIAVGLLEKYKNKTVDELNEVAQRVFSSQNEG